MACVTLKRPLDLDPFEALYSPNRSQTKRRRCTPIKGSDRDSPSTSVPHPPASAFREATLSPSEVANQLRDELKRMRRRGQILTENDFETSQQRQTPSPTLAAPMSPADCMMDSFSSLSTGDAQRKAAAAEKPVFTLKQMTLICERMCKEQTDKVRDEYDRILQQKLSEQYDAFVKFIHNQIQQRFNQSTLPSYLS